MTLYPLMSHWELSTIMLLIIAIEVWWQLETSVASQRFCFWFALYIHSIDSHFLNTHLCPVMLMTMNLFRTCRSVFCSVSEHSGDDQRGPGQWSLSWGVHFGPPQVNYRSQGQPVWSRQGRNLVSPGLQPQHFYMIHLCRSQHQSVTKTQPFMEELQNEWHVHSCRRSTHVASSGAVVCFKDSLLLQESCTFIKRCVIDTANSTRFRPSGRWLITFHSRANAANRGEQHRAGGPRPRGPL